MITSRRIAPRGFTLIELLVVIAIIALLSSVVLASLASSRVKARNTQRLELVNEYRNALEFVRTNTGTYPVTASTICLGDYSPTNCGNGGGIVIPQSSAVNALLAQYLPTLPQLPPTPPYTGLDYWTCPGFSSCTRWNAPNDTYILEWIQEGVNSACGIGFPEFAPDPSYNYTWCAYVHR